MVLLLSNILFIVLFLVMLGILIAIHEFGHYIAAKAFGVYVFEFAVGFGPKIFRKKIGETYYSLRALPLGGYVAMLGEEDSIPEEFIGKIKLEDDEEVVLTVASEESVAPKEEDVLIVSPKRSLLRINRGKKSVIMSAGIIMNLVLGFLLFVLANGVIGYTKYAPTLTVAENSVAASTYGLKTGDEIVRGLINVYDNGEFQGQDIYTYGEATLDATEYYMLYNFTSFKDLKLSGVHLIFVDKVVAESTAETPLAKSFDNYVYAFTEVGTVYVDVPLVDGDDVSIKNIMFNVVESGKDKDDNPIYLLEDIGLSLSSVRERTGFKQTFVASGQDFKNASTAVLLGLKSLFTEGLTNLSGVVGIYSVATGALTDLGFSYYIYLWGLISVNLALFNLLPFPPLDGWHLLVTAVEAITRQEISPRFKQVAQVAGALLLIVLTIAILFKDIFLIGVV